MLKDAMYWKRVNYKSLSELLLVVGIAENPNQLRHKINRGKFSFAFFLQCMRAMGVDKFEPNWADLEKERLKTDVQQ